MTRILVSTRMVAPDRAGRLAARAGAPARTADGLRTVTYDPALGAVSWAFPTTGLFVLEAMPGRRLDGLPAAAPGAGLEVLGRGVAALHRVPPGAAPAMARFTTERLRSAAAVVAGARPGARSAGSAAPVLPGRPPPRPGSAAGGRQRDRTRGEHVVSRPALLLHCQTRGGWATSSAR